MSYSLVTLFSDDSNRNQNDDEKLASNLYLCSLCFQLNELKCIKQKLNLINDHSSNEYKKISNHYDNMQKKNDWLLEQCNKVKNIKCINFDKLPECCGIKGVQTVDSFIIDCSKKRCYLIEFKNCTKSELVKHYLTGTDSILYKFKGSKNILNVLSISSFSSINELIGNTEVIAVCNKNDCVEPMEHKLPVTKIVSRDAVSKKQNKATRCNNKNGKAIQYNFYMQSGHKKREEIIELFRKDISKLRFSMKSSFDKKQAGFTILCAQDISKVIENSFFDCIDWGDYKRFFINNILK